jgi:hypothetical protein
MNCPAGAAGDEEAGTADGIGGIEIVGGSGGVSEEIQATVSGTEFTEGPGGLGVGAVGTGGTQATVAGGGRAGGAGASTGTFRRAPHFSQNLDASAFRAPHSSQNRTDSEAMNDP